MPWDQPGFGWIVGKIVSGAPTDVRVTMVYTEAAVQTPPDVRVTMAYTEVAVKP